MKKILKEQKGYTIIIALLLIVLFLGASAVFLQSSLSHAKQEQTVDRNNLAVVAAEMGSERYTKELVVHMNKKYADLLKEATLKKEGFIEEGRAFKSNVSYAGCPSVKTSQELMDCRFNNLRVQLAMELQNSIQSFLGSYGNTKVQIDTDVSYTLETFKLQNASSTVPENKLLLVLRVFGEKGNTSSKLLQNDLAFFNPFLLTKNFEEMEDIKLERVSNFFPQMENKLLPICPVPVPVQANFNMVPCQLNANSTTPVTQSDIERYVNEVIQKGKKNAEFYIRVTNVSSTNLNQFTTQEIPVYFTASSFSGSPNFNGANNAHIFRQGVLNLGNLNNANNNFVVAESIVLGQNQTQTQTIFNSTFILTGNNTKPQFPTFTLIVGNGSRLCINASGITANPSNLTTAGTGVIFQYPETPKTLPAATNVRYFENADEFMRACGVTFSYKPDFRVPKVPIVEGMDMDWEVNYTP